jgi:hypothetical protein
MARRFCAHAHRDFDAWLGAKFFSSPVRPCVILDLDLDLHHGSNFIAPRNKETPR